MSLPMCAICKQDYEWAEGEVVGSVPHEPTNPSDGCFSMGVCPTCRRRCEIGKRVEGMKPAENGFGIGGVSYAAGRNEALREAKGEK